MERIEEITQKELYEIHEHLNKPEKYSVPVLLGWYRHDIKYLLDKLTAMQEENERLKSYRESQDVEVSDDGEHFCPRCHQTIAGYYSEYCEFCGQAISLPDGEE